MEIIFPTPKICPLCGKKQDFLNICSECINLKERFKYDHGQCNRCGTFLRHGVYCPTCYLWPKEFIKNTAVFPYQKEYEKMVRDFKFNYHGYLSSPISMAIFNELCLNQALIRDVAESLIIPVPMSSLRKREKGYNQAEILSKELARIMDTEMKTNVLKRSRNTPHQTGLNRRDRKINLKNAFYVEDKNKKDLENRVILLVDDVITTSTTLNECARTLINHGAQKIFSVTIASGSNY